MNGPLCFDVLLNRNRGSLQRFSYVRYSQISGIFSKRKLEKQNLSSFGYNYSHFQSFQLLVRSVVSKTLPFISKNTDIDCLWTYSRRKHRIRLELIENKWNWQVIHLIHLIRLNTVIYIPTSEVYWCFQFSSVCTSIFISKIRIT